MKGGGLASLACSKGIDGTQVELVDIVNYPPKLNECRDVVDASVI